MNQLQISTWLRLLEDKRRHNGRVCLYYSVVKYCVLSSWSTHMCVSVNCNTQEPLSGDQQYQMPAQQLEVAIYTASFSFTNLLFEIKFWVLSCGGSLHFFG